MTGLRYFLVEPNAELVNSVHAATAELMSVRVLHLAVEVGWA